MSQDLSKLLMFSLFFGFAIGLPSTHELTYSWERAFTHIPVAIHCSAFPIPLHQVLHATELQTCSSHPFQIYKMCHISRN